MTCRYRTQNTRVTEPDLVCTVKFDDDLPNGPFVEGSALNSFQQGLTVSVPPADTTWGQVLQLVSEHHQEDLDAFYKGGEKRYLGKGRYEGNVATCTAVHVKFKGGKVPDDGEAREGSCTVKLSISIIRTSEKQCTIA